MTYANYGFRMAWLVAVSLVLVGVAPAAAQLPNDTSMPPQRYYAAFADYYSGEYERAYRQFDSLSNSAYRDVKGRFLDSVCYWTMMGECLYHTGDYVRAIESYEAALDLYINWINWSDRTQLPPSIQAEQNAVARAEITWGTPTRVTQFGRFHTGYNVLLGQSDQENLEALQRGGVIDAQRFRSVDVAEVMRCVGIALHRRRIIKGPVCRLDPMTRKLANALAGRPTGGATIPGAWYGVTAGLAQASLEEWDKAAALLESSLQVAGTYDHPLTPLALLEMGYGALARQQFDTAQALFLESSYSAGVMGQFDVIEEALRMANTTQMIANRTTVLPALAPAAQWGARQRARQLIASVLIELAFATAESGDSAAAADVLGEIRRPMSGTDLAASPLGGRAHYVGALVELQNGRLDPALNHLREFGETAAKWSLWVYQLALADSLIIDNRVQATQAEALYAALLREPTPTDWLTDPVETLSYLATPHLEPMMRWFELAVERDADVQAIEISELARRHRFFSALPLGGRVLGLRWVVFAPDAALSPEARQQKQDLLSRYPALKDGADRMAQLIDQLARLPVVPDKDSTEATTSQQLYKDLAQVSAEQEALLNAIALRHEPCELAFPPRLLLEEIQARLQPGQVIVATFATGARYHIATITQGSYAIEPLTTSDTVGRDVMNLLRQIGVAERGTTVEPELLQNTEWEPLAAALAEQLVPKLTPDFLTRFEEVIVVPDGALWYLPFEVLRVGSGDQAQMLGQLVKVRYAPTLSTAVPDERVARRFLRTAVLAERVFARDDEERVAAAAEAWRASRPGVVVPLDATGRVPAGFLGTTLDQLVVWHEIKDPERSVMALYPLPLDQARDGSTLDAWMQLPWPGPDVVVLPGYSSVVETNARARAAGDDLFLTVCGLMASGARTVLISRWRVGGQSTLDLTREFVNELGSLSASAAWQRSRQLLAEQELDLTAEPRFRPTELANPLRGEHPYLWAGNLLVDTGTAPPAPEADAPDTSK